MDSNGSVVIHFEHGVDRHISTLVMKGRYEEITYSHLVDRIGKKLKIDVDATKLQLSYFPLVLNNKNSCYILDDEDVLGYLMMVDKKNRRCVLHVELAKIVSENQSNEMFSMNEENLSDARANDGMVGVGELEIVPHIQEDEFEHEKISEEGDEMDDREELPAVTAVEPPVVNSEWDDGIDISLHQELATREEVRDLVDKGVHSNCFEVDIQKSNPRVYILKCRGAGCRWYLRAAKLKNSDFFSIRTYRKIHTCSRGDASVMKKKKRGTPSLVASVVHSDYPGKYKTPDPKTLIDLVQNKLGVKVSYSTALRGKNKALSDLRGNPEESFARLPSYLYMLQRMNPDTITRLEVDEKNQFKYMFFALGACIEGFKAMRQVIIMDGTHLKGVYKGVLLIATAQDPDHHHYPLAFAVVDGEKNASWEWFLTILKTLIPDDPQLVFCTDRNQSIIKKVHEVYPLAIHGYCNYHLSNNVSGACSNVNKKGVAKKFRSIAGIYSEVEFIKCYNDFRKMYPQAAEYLDDSVHETKWARCKFPGERYNIDTTNTVESINGVLKEPRKYALLPMLDVIVEKITEWFNKYRLLSLRVPERQILILHVHGILHHIYPSAKKLKVTELNTFEGHYNVLGDDGHGYLVDLSNKTCYCRCFDIDRYPCVHALAAIMARGEMAEHYCSRYYWMEQWTLAYYRTIYPVPHHSTWESSEIPEEIRYQVVLPPYVEKKKRKTTSY
ncbi:uncharacterized protein LOC106377198 [Brassica napus]|uniref:uncharacterized protein LOC106377198 n=1 Tax=Brassica napus TaxID=3708 RepID=UPI00207A7EF6|nr:uncharacterized protein LOC106377198 [Brassica napus]